MKNRVESLSDVEKQSAFSRAWHSIRTQSSLATAIILLLVLAVFYVGGRIVLVHLIRDTEQQVKEIGSDISRIAYHNSDRVRQIALSCVPEGAVWPADTAKVAAKPGNTFAASFGKDGRFSGASLRRGESVETLEVAAFEPYLATLTDWTLSTLRSGEGGSATGILRICGETHYAAMVRYGEGCLLVGMPFDSGVFSSQVNDSLVGLDIRITNRKAEITVRAAVPRDVARSRERGGFGIVPMFSEAANFYSGGFWNLGASQFEAMYAIRDIAGNAIAMVAVSIPKTFSTVTRAAIGRLSFFIALVGIVFVLPIFWIQSRILLNPLSKMTKEIAELGRHNADTDCPRLDWHGKDEFALLALSVNRMLETISARSIAIAQTEARHQALIDGLPDALAVFDPIGRLVAVSKEAEQSEPIPGLVPGETPSAEVFGQSAVERFLRIIGEVFRGGSVGKIRLQVVDAGGASGPDPARTFEIRLTRMDEYFALAIIRDMSDEMREHRLRLAAEAKVKDAEKRESLTLLAAGIAHDMNNVLSVVLNAAEAADADPSGDSTKSLETIRDAVRRGSSMMRELMAFAGENRIAFSRVSPKMVIEDVRPLTQGVVGENVIVDTCCAEDVPDVDVDPNQFWKVLFNFVKNAGEAIGTRPGRILIAAERLDLSAEEAERFNFAGKPVFGPGALFTVADDGPGIPPEILPRIFDPYVSSKSLGRGLGLATVCTIVETHGGGIRVESQLDKGTTFSVFLPESKLAKKKRTAENAGPLEGDVLLVDNDEAILRTTSILLKAMKLTPHVARDRQEALTVIRRYSGDLRAIVLDAHLGGIDTVRLLGAFRSSAPGVPVVVSSGSAAEEVENMFKDAPYDTFLAKPYTIAELRQAILGAGYDKIGGR